MSDLLKYLTILGKKEYVKKNYNLENIKLTLDYLSNPQNKINNVVHITGTNGKGSTAVYTSVILNSLGYKVGLYTSPHIYDVTERIQINSEPISYPKLKKYLEDIYSVVPKKLFLKLTYFELLTCVMFLYFYDEQVDFAVLEVGLGGKLDATNVVSKSIVSCITSISLDHTEVLGKTEFEILKDKSAIIKPNSVFICGDVKEKLKDYLYKLCKKLNTKFVDVPKEICKISLDFKNWQTFCQVKDNKKIFEFTLPVCSLVQPYNVLLAIKIVEELNKMNLVKNFDYKKISQIIKHIQIPFRMQKIKYKKLDIVIDGAHNPAAVENFVKTLLLSPYKDIVLCFTIMKEKDYKSVIETLAKLKGRIEKFVVYRLPIRRCQKLNLIYNEAKKYFGNKTMKFCKISEMLKYLEKNCNKNKIFFVGSFYIAGVFKNEKR
jgi:dihydrofolate synthase/folylpolyglutamate synthase